MFENDTICALATPQGSGAIGLIRISGEKAMPICDCLFEGKNLSEQKGQSLLFGKIKDGETVVDEVLLSLFKAPHSYTGEDVIEISCHGSSYILTQVLQLLLKNGARLAQPGEFTMRAFANGKMDLAQAEAVADLIASESKGAHQIAMNQMRGGFSKFLQDLREELIDFTALIELELDFGEEDVEFADRQDLKNLVDKILGMITNLLASFSTGNALKNGIPVAIVGKPNVGKSTLLNALLKEEKALVSDVAGTTRDSIEDQVNIEGVSFRFIDTAGIRSTDDKVEKMGIERTYKMVDKASIVLLLIDVFEESKEEIEQNISQLREHLKGTEQVLKIVANKSDKLEQKAILDKMPKREDVLLISALKQDKLDELLNFFTGYAKDKMNQSQGVLISNLRHLEALTKAEEALQRVNEGLMNNITGDFLALDIRQALYFLGEITGSIDIDRDILGSIFSRFCIGK